MMTLAYLLYIGINITKEIIVSSFILEDTVCSCTLTNTESFSILTTFEDVFTNLVLCVAVFCLYVCLCTMCEPGVCRSGVGISGCWKPGPLQVR